MRRYNYSILSYCIVAILFFGSCSRDEFQWNDQEGTLRLQIVMDDQVKVQSRALSTEEQAVLAAECQVRIYNEEGLVRFYEGMDQVPQEIQLKAGDYRLHVTAGDSVAASFDKRFFRVDEMMKVVAQTVTPVQTTCRMRNTLVQVSFDASLDEALKDYQVTVSTSAGSLLFTPETVSAIGYYMLAAEGSELKWHFAGTTIANEPFATEGVVTANPMTLYQLHFKYAPSGSANQDGGGRLNVEVETTPIEENTSEVEYYQRPVITATKANGDLLDFAQDYTTMVGNRDEISFQIATSSPLTSVQLSCSQFISLGFPANQFDLMTLSDAEREELAQKGITFQNSLNAVTGQDSMKGVLGSLLLQQMTSQEGNYEVTIYAKDQQEKERSSTLRILVSDATILTEEAPLASIWSSKAEVRGSLTQETSEDVSFRYREAGTAEWSSIPAVREGNSLSAQLTGLTPGTTYEYQAMVGSEVSKVTCRFTTEEAQQMENSSFEYWSQPTNALLLCDEAQGASMYWDSGNHGSATMKKNITVNDTEFVHEGTYSAKLSSQFVGIFTIGKFAAGNAFVGKYLKTDGTDGVLGLGRPFHSRPKALKGYVRYRPGAVSYTSSDVPQLVKGELDKAQIYIAIGDWAGEEYEGEVWPVVIKTKASERQLFQPDAPGVIAYGEQTWESDTEGDGLVEFTIPLNYRDLTRKPTHILVVCSASKYGDYFAGGSSTLWIDDFSLVYE